MRASVFAKREPTDPVKPDQWDQRTLDTLRCRVAWAAISNNSLVGASWTTMLDHLGLANTKRLSVLGDGAVDLGQGGRTVQRLHERRVGRRHLSRRRAHPVAVEKMFDNRSAARQWGESRGQELIEMEGPKFIDQLKPSARPRAIPPNPSMA